MRKTLCFALLSHSIFFVILLFSSGAVSQQSLLSSSSYLSCDLHACTLEFRLTAIQDGLIDQNGQIVQHSASNQNNDQDAQESQHHPRNLNRPSDTLQRSITRMRNRKEVLMKDLLIEETRLCHVLSSWNSCIQKQSKNCRGDLEYHTIASYVSKSISNYKCQVNEPKVRKVLTREPLRSTCNSEMCNRNFSPMVKGIQEDIKSLQIKMEDNQRDMESNNQLRSPKSRNNKSRRRHVDEELQNDQSSARSEHRYCFLLTKYNECVERMEGRCRGRSDYNQVLAVSKDWLNQYKCQVDERMESQRNLHDNSSKSDKESSRKSSGFLSVMTSQLLSAFSSSSSSISTSSSLTYVFLLISTFLSIIICR